MTIFRLSVAVISLGLAVGMVLTNPSMENYLDFVESELKKAIDRGELSPSDRDMSVVRSIFLSHSHEVVRSFVGPRTVRSDWGLVSLYRSRIVDSEILVLGVGGQFVPLKGIDDEILRLGRMAF